jgi:uncharacterized protein (TIGR03435 family)
MDSDHFDIDATVDGALSVSVLYLPDGKGSAGLAYSMLRTLLADRFKLVVHTETQQLPIYALAVAKRDGTLGAQLRQSDVDCDAVLAEMTRTGRPAAPREPGQMPPCTTQSSSGHLAANAIPMSQLAEMLVEIRRARDTRPDHPARELRHDTRLDGRPFDLHGDSGTVGTEARTIMRSRPPCCE